MPNVNEFTIDDYNQLSSDRQIDLAIYYGFTEGLEIALNNGANIDILITEPNGFQTHPLHIAVTPEIIGSTRIEHIDSIDLLLNYSPNPTFTNSSGNTPLHVAALNTDLDDLNVLKKILAYSIDYCVINMLDFNAMILYKANSEGKTVVDLLRDFNLRFNDFSELIEPIQFDNISDNNLETQESDEDQQENDEDQPIIQIQFDNMPNNNAEIQESDEDQQESDENQPLIQDELEFMNQQDEDSEHEDSAHEDSEHEDSEHEDSANDSYKKYEYINADSNSNRLPLKRLHTEREDIDQEDALYLVNKKQKLDDVTANNTKLFIAAEVHQQDPNLMLNIQNGEPAQQYTAQDHQQDQDLGGNIQNNERVE